jgi:hypothetical protein
MLQTAPSSMQSQIQYQAQYIVYAYDVADDKNSDTNRWTKLMTSEDEKKIMMQAQDLFQSQKYQKIEIKKTYFDKKKGHHRAATFHVLEVAPQHNVFMIASTMLLTLTFAGLCYLQFM